MVVGIAVVGGGSGCVWSVCGWSWGGTVVAAARLGADVAGAERRSATTGAAVVVGASVVVEVVELVVELEVVVEASTTTTTGSGSLTALTTSPPTTTDPTTTPIWPHPESNTRLTWRIQSGRVLERLRQHVEARGPQVDRCGLKVAVTQHLLHGPQVVASFQHVRRRGVAQGVG